MSIRMTADDSALRATAVAEPSGRLWTVTFWAQLVVDQAENSLIFVLEDADESCGLRINDTRVLQVTDNATATSTNVTMVVGDWYRIGLVCNGTSVTSYVGRHSEALTVQAHTKSPPSGVADIWIGSGFFNHFNGRLAAFKMWESALTQTQVTTELDQYHPAISTNLIRYHPWTSWDASTQDESGNNRHLTAGGAAVAAEESPLIPRSRSTGRTTTVDTNSHALTMPSAIEPGDRLVCHFAVDGAPTATMTGWNKLGQASNTTVVTGAVFEKEAAGGDTGTVSTTTNEQSSHEVLAIPNALAPTGTSANGSSTNSNPPNHTGDGDLFIATRAGDSTVVPTASPALFGTLYGIAAAGTAGASAHHAERVLEAASLDPGTFTSNSEQWVSWTLALDRAPNIVVHQGAVSMAAAGSFTADGVRAVPAAVSMAAAGALTAAATATVPAAVGMAAGASLTAAATATVPATATMAAGDDYSAAASLTVPAAVAMTAAADLTAAADVIALAAISMAAGSSFTAEAAAVAFGAVSLAAAATYVAAAEAIPSGGLTMAAGASFTADGSVTAFGVGTLAAGATYTATGFAVTTAAVDMAAGAQLLAAGVVAVPAAVSLAAAAAYSASGEIASGVGAQLTAAAALEVAATVTVLPAVAFVAGAQLVASGLIGSDDAAVVMAAGAGLLAWVGSAWPPTIGVVVVDRVANGTVSVGVAATGSMQIDPAVTGTVDVVDGATGIAEIEAVATGDMSVV